MPSVPSRSCSTCSTRTPSGFALAVAERAEHDRARLVKQAGVSPLREHAVDTIRAFADVFQEQHTALERRQVRRADQRGEHRQVAAEQHAARAAAVRSPSRSSRACGVAPSTAAMKRVASASSARPSAAIIGACSEPRPAHAHSACSALMSLKPASSLGRRASAASVEVLEQARRAVAAARREDRIRRVVLDRRAQLGAAPRVVARQVAVLIEDAGVDVHVVARAQLQQAALEVVAREWAGRRDHAHARAGRELAQRSRQRCAFIAAPPATPAAAAAPA